MRQYACKSGRRCMNSPALGNEGEASMQNERNPRRDQALQMRDEGMTGKAITAALGVSRAIVSKWLDPRYDLPGGVCECGCGQPTKLDVCTWKPRRYVPGHGNRGTLADDYIVDESTGCWLWQRRIDIKGYGAIHRDGYGRAHRWYYAQLVGPIPDGLTIDHLCRNKRCVNPAHMEPVTAQENSRRAHADRRAA